jgi:AcrR family transcriptional regulator
MATSSSPQPTKRGPYRTGIRRRAEIIASATEVFGEHGYVGGTLAQIAQQVGVTPQAVVKLFGSKEGLLTEVLESSDAQNAKLHFADLEGLDHLDASGALVRHNMQHRGMLELMLTLGAEATSPTHPAHEYMVRRYADYATSIAARLRHARDAGQIRTFTDAQLLHEARGYAALMDGLQLQWLLDPDFDLVGAWEHHYAELRQRWTRGVPAAKS